MGFLHKFDWSFKSIVKIVGAVLLAFLALSLIITLFGFSIRTLFQGVGTREMAPGYGGKYAPMPSSGVIMDRSTVPPRDFSAGEEAENFEVKTYDTTVRSRHFEQDCQRILGLKSRAEMIFENSSQNDDSCWFRFKATKAAEEEVVNLLQAMKPDYWNVTVESVKLSVETQDQQLDILQKQLASIEETLAKAQTAYDEVSSLATRKQDVESLAQIVDNRLNLIDRLTNQRLQIKQQIDSYAKAKADTLDRLKYSFFNVTVSKDLIFNWKQIKESWNQELKTLVTNFNEVLQGLSVQLVTYFIRFVQAALYFFISVFLVKGIWIVTKRIWKGKGG